MSVSYQREESIAMITMDDGKVNALGPDMLAAINTAYNQVSSDISLAQAGADQKIVQSKRAVEIETLRAQAEVQPLVAVAEQLSAISRRTASPKWRCGSSPCSAMRRFFTSSSSTNRSELRVTRNW